MLQLRWFLINFDLELIARSLVNSNPIQHTSLSRLGLPRLTNELLNTSFCTALNFPLEEETLEACTKKTFHGSSKQASVSAPSSHFHHSLIFAINARGLPMEWSPQRSSTQVGSSLTRQK